MRQQPGHRHSIFCIVPPVVLRDIARNGTEEERQAALDTLAADSTFRTLRPETSSPPRGGADYLRYTISVVTPERSHTVHLTDPIEDPQVQALVEYLEDKTK